MVKLCAGGMKGWVSGSFSATVVEIKGIYPKSKGLKPMSTQNMHLSRRAFVGGAAAFGVALSLPATAFADPTSADKQAEASAMRVKLDDMQARLSQASDNYYVALSDRDNAVAKMDEAQAKIDANNEEIASLQERLGGRARTMYRNGQTTFLDVLLGSSSFEDLTRNWDALTTMNQSDADMVQQTKDLRADNEAQHAEYKAQKQVAQDKLEESESIKKEAEKLVDEYQTQVNSLDAEVAALVEQERQAAAAAAAAREAAEIAAGGNPVQNGTTTVTPSAPSNNGGNTGGGSNNGGGNTGGGGNAGGGNSGGGNNYAPAPSGTPNGAALGVAAGFLGVPYVWGGTTPSGFDCSGLTSYCYAATGYSIGRTTGDQYATARYIFPVSQAEPGDVLWNGGHVGICASSGGGSYIHAPQPGEVVCYSSWPQFSAALRW